MRLYAKLMQPHWDYIAIIKATNTFCFVFLPYGLISVF